MNYVSNVSKPKVSTSADASNANNDSELCAKADDLLSNQQYQNAQAVYQELLANEGTSSEVRKTATEKLGLLSFTSPKGSPRGICFVIPVKDIPCLTATLLPGSFPYRDMSLSLKEIQSGIHFTLATEYEERAALLTNRDAQPDSDHGLVFDETSEIFHGSMSIFHLQKASELGLAKATLKLSEIYKGSGAAFAPAVLNAMPGISHSTTSRLQDSFADHCKTLAEEQARVQHDYSTLAALGIEHL